MYKFTRIKTFVQALVGYLFTKRTLIILCILFAILIFRGLVRVKFDDWLVKPCLATISSSVFSDCLILLLLPVTLIIVRYYLRHNLQLHPDWILITLFVLGLYIYCRVNHVYLLTKFQTLPQLYYADIIYLWALGILIIKGWGEWHSHKSPIYSKNPFLVDIPIKNATGDLLNRRKFAERIASKIQSKLTVADAGALAIGVTGEWGSGKTSFSNMILEAIDTKNRIIIHFNPWRSSSAQKIIEDFFELMIAELKKYDATLSANIYSYAKTLTKIDENILTKTLQALGEVFSSTNKNEAYNSINRSIGAINKQFIIFIDDLDRLDKLEIIEVLRIIRNTANFNNVIYLVSYDKGYVLEAVKSFNEYNHQSFLEKIFQFEFALPMYESGIIRKYLKGLLKDGLQQKLHDQVEAIIDSSLHKEINFTNEIIHTHREAIRLANCLLFEITNLENDVFFYDFYLLQLVKLKYPFVYQEIIEYKALFFINDPKENDTLLRLRREH
ncbi:MAG: hypothetical protein EOP45_09305, partial [Sphingobacteriaceae bacterium]